MRVIRQLRPVIGITIILISLLSAIGEASAGDWANWRGPTYNGATDEKNLPTEWSTTKNVLWSTPMPGISSASPIVSGDRVFLVSNDATRTKLYAFCIHRDTGQVLWRKLVSQGASANIRNDMASSSPVTDGKLVYFIFGTSDLLALDFAGNEVWSRNLQKEFGIINQQFGYSSSPLLYKGRLYLPLLHGQWTTGGSWDSYTDKDSYVLCLDAATGAVVWNLHRPSDANGESFDSYASAVPYEHGGVSQIIVQGGDYLSAQDAATGEELWRQQHNPRKGRNWRVIPSPIVVDELIIGMLPRGGAAFAVRPGSKREMAYTDSHWIYAKRTSDVATPAYYDGRLYIVNGARKQMICLDPVTGKEIWTGDLTGSARIWSSPTIADGKIYVLDENGTTTVVATGDTFKLLGQSALGGTPSKSTIAAADGKLFIRTSEKLYCIGS